jgi:type VI secretion system protein ImpL
LLAYIIAALVVAVALLLAFGIAALLHLQGAAYVVFVVIVVLIGIAAAVTILLLHFRSKRQKEQEAGGSGSGETGELDLLLNDANRKLRSSQQGAKTLDALPLLYVLGQSGAAKTSTVVQSGLDPELVAGTAAHGSEQASTEVLNLWFTGSAVLLELGASLRGNNASLARLVHRTRAKAYRSAFGTGAAPRAAIVCLSVDQLLAADGGQSLLASARSTNADLREISRLLGMPIPVYVIVTKLDRVSHFEQYVRNLSEEEVRQVLGITLPRSAASPGTYADQASRALATAIDGIVYKLGEFRTEMLDRETDARNSSGVYEFPREFGKLRKNLNQYLVELCKPSQLSANPYLRGFYFTGIRARVVERAVNAPVAAHVPAMQEAGATQFLNLSRMRAEAESRTAAPTMVASRVPQWTFLPRLLPEVILSDKSALAATTQSAPARLFRRILYGSLVVLLGFYLVFLLISYFNNAALEGQVREAAGTLSRSTAVVPGMPELRALDDLRKTIVQLDDYAVNGAPLTYRFGLYHGGRVDAQARRVYFDHFRSLLLNPAQQNFVAFMRALPNTPAASTDFSSYLTAYNPLKAYLITTSHPEKSQVKFLTPVFLQYWMGSRSVDADQQQLAQAQIDFYGNELLHQPPYKIDPDTGVVEHARAYLSNFVAGTRIYQAMLSDADRTSTAIDFNRMYPGSASYVTDPRVVRGAFTRAGFGFMQDAIQHPDKYAQGETWVLGTQAAQALNTSQVSKDLGAQYTSDFLKEWHAFLISAHVGSCGSLKEAPARLNALAGPASPLLALFLTVSHNTAVTDPTIKSTFQPAQALVDPNATDRLIGPGNATYVTALSQLAGAVELASQNPAAATDPTVFAPVSQQVVAAGGAAQQAAQAFNVDQQMHTEGTVLGLMQAPIQCVAKLAPSPGAPANGGGQKVCAAITPLLGKFPFAPSSPVQASLAEVDAAFAPETGALWGAYNSTLKQFLIPQGSQYGANPAAPLPVNPRFAQYFSRAAHVSSTLYPAGQKSASLTFNLRFLPGNGVSNATLVVDGQRIPAGLTSQQFTWNGTAAQRASLVFDNNEVLQMQGTWALFQLVRTAQITRLAGGYRLDYPINTATTTTVAGHAVGGGGGNVKIASFELSGPGADLLVPEGLAGLSCGLPVVR